VLHRFRPLWNLLDTIHVGDDIFTELIIFLQIIVIDAVHLNGVQDAAMYVLVLYMSSPLLHFSIA
jgi:hypothetical protein